MEFLEKEWVNMGLLVDLSHTLAMEECSHDRKHPLRSRTIEIIFSEIKIMRIPDESESTDIEITKCFLESFFDTPSDRHDLSDGLHL
jgi:hypothetical protein